MRKQNSRRVQPLPLPARFCCSTCRYLDRGVLGGCLEADLLDVGVVGQQLLVEKRLFYSDQEAVTAHHLFTYHIIRVFGISTSIWGVESKTPTYRGIELRYTLSKISVD